MKQEYRIEVERAITLIIEIVREYLEAEANRPELPTIDIELQ